MATTAPAGVYPELNVEHIQDPNRLWAIPLLGFIAKYIILIPVLFWLGILGFAWGIFGVINSFVVLFSGRYWQPAYDLTMGMLRLYLKSWLYLAGLTDRYPGFGFGIDQFTAPSISLEMELPENPSRLWALPFLSGFAKVVILIPYLIYVSVLYYAAWLGMIVSSFVVLFSGRYPESTYELTRDCNRVYAAAMAYFTGVSDKYPSFWISMNHAGVKVVLIVIGCLLLFGNAASGGGDTGTSMR